MNILVVEDDENKRNQLTGFLNSQFPSATLQTANSLQSGLRAIIQGGVDLVLLDMTMPTFDIGENEDGGRPQAYAGREILRQMERREIDIPVIVVTQFDRFGEGSDILGIEELDAQLIKEHRGVYGGAIYYDVTLGGWKEKLTERILHLAEGKL